MRYTIEISGELVIEAKSLQSARELAERECKEIANCLQYNVEALRSSDVVRLAPTGNDTIKPVRYSTWKKQIGHLYAFITQHQTGEDFRYTASFEKEDRNTDNAPSSATFEPDDLLLLAKLADAVHTSIMQVESKSDI